MIEFYDEVQGFVKTVLAIASLVLSYIIGNAAAFHNRTKGLSDIVDGLRKEMKEVRNDYDSLREEFKKAKAQIEECENTKEQLQKLLKKG